MEQQELPNSLSNHLASKIVCRFAPTCSGSAHPGTLLAAMLSFLDAQKLNAQFILRMEDIDPSSVKEHWRKTLVNDLEWFGLNTDSIMWQSKNTAIHEAMMDKLAASGRLYSCNCSRSVIARSGIKSLAGGWVYPGTCRSNTIYDWRGAQASLRINLEGINIELRDESGTDLSQEPSRVMGDPMLVRADGSFTYHLAVVADDNYSGVNRIVRGSDLASSSATQVALRTLLDWPIPSYRHHLLFLEKQGQKFAKFHQAVSLTQLRDHYSPDSLRGFLAHACGLLKEPSPLSWQVAHEIFDWNKVLQDDVVINWDGLHLSL